MALEVAALARCTAFHVCRAWRVEPRTYPDLPGAGIPGTLAPFLLLAGNKGILLGIMPNRGRFTKVDE